MNGKEDRTFCFKVSVVGKVTCWRVKKLIGLWVDAGISGKADRTFYFQEELCQEFKKPQELL